MWKLPEIPLRNWPLSLATLAILATPLWAQRVALEHSTLFTSSTACSTGGINSTFGASWANGARALSSVFNFQVQDRAGTVFLADHATLEVNCTKADDDSLIVLLLGYSQGDTSNVYADTVYVKAVANKATYVNFSPSLLGDVLMFPSSGKLSIANEDSGANGAFPYFGAYLDTNIWTARLILWCAPYEVSGATTITIGDYQLDSDTTSWDATKTDLGAEQDTSSALTWPDTVATILTVSDTTSFTARILARADSSTVLYWPDTTVVLTNVKALINARADSSTALYWPDTTVVLTYTKALAAARADSATALYWADTTIANGIATNYDVNARADSATALYWADTTIAGTGIATQFDLTLKAPYNRPIQFTIINPKNSLDTAAVYEAPVAMTIDSIFAFSHNDTCAFSLIESARTGGTVSLIDAVDANVAGVNGFKVTETTISDASIAAASLISYLKSTDSTEVIKVSIYWH